MDAEPEYPGDGQWKMAEFAVADAAAGGPIAVITPEGGELWLLSCGFHQFGAIFGTPDPHLLCVVDRSELVTFIDSRDPDNQAHLDVLGIRVAAALDEQLLLFGDWRHVTAWGIDGVRWQSEPIFSDDLKFRRTDNGRIVCVGSLTSDYEQVEVVLDAASGRVIT